MIKLVALKNDKYQLTFTIYLGVNMVKKNAPN